MRQCRLLCAHHGTTSILDLVGKLAPRPISQFPGCGARVQSIHTLTFSVGSLLLGPWKTLR